VWWLYRKQPEGSNLHKWSRYALYAAILFTVIWVIILLTSVSKFIVWVILILGAVAGGLWAWRNCRRGEALRFADQTGGHAQGGSQGGGTELPTPIGVART